MKDVCIIGYGPAGVTAALYLKKIGYDITLFGKDSGMLTSHDMIENYYGFPQKISGTEMMKKGLEQAENENIDILHETVLDIIPELNSFIIKTENHTYQTKCVVLATGKKRIELNVPGFLKFRGKGVHLCATCDAFFYRNNPIALVGHGSYMLSELSFLENFTKDITIFTQDKTYKHVTYQVVYDPVVSIDGTSRASSIKTTKNTYSVSGVFVALGFPTSLELAEKMGIITEKGNIFVDKDMQTNVGGIFACGDITGGKLQIAKAVYEGMLAADGIHKYLKQQKNNLS